MEWILWGIVALFVACMGLFIFACIWDELKDISGKGCAKLAVSYNIPSQELSSKKNPFEEVYRRERRYLQYTLSALVVVIALLVTAVLFSWPFAIISLLCILLIFVVFLLASRFMDYPKLRKQYSRFPEFRRQTIYAYDLGELVTHGFLRTAWYNYFKSTEGKD